MNVLHLIAGEFNGGAARGAYWLHKALRKRGIQSNILTNARGSFSDASVVSIGESRSKLYGAKIKYNLGKLPLLLYRQKQNKLFSTGLGGYNFLTCDQYKKADIIHLHWINGLVSTRTLRHVKKPIVWTLRDMWPLTGGCHISYDCVRYTSGCGFCPQLGSKQQRDLSSCVVKNKLRNFPPNLTVIGISNWISSCAKKSTVFKDHDVRTISNNVDTSAFRPIDKQVARALLMLPTNKKILLAGAYSNNDEYKGFSLLVQALNKIRTKEIHLVVFGGITEDTASRLPCSHTCLGFLNDELSLRLTYSAADVFIAPSRMEPFGKTLVEAMACGTPVACFDSAGPKDIVEHKVTGYLAEAFLPEDLAFGIDWILGRTLMEIRELSVNARQRAEDKFDSLVIADEYISLYRELTSLKN